MSAHPEAKAKREAENRAWCEEQNPFCREAWLLMSELIPPERISVEAMEAAGLAPALAKRIRSKHSLRLIRLHPQDVEAIHKGDLKIKYGCLLLL